MSPPANKIYVGTERCGLCRSRLPWSGESDLNLWDLDFRAAFCLEPNDENTTEITRTANLSDIHDQQIEVGLNGFCQNQSITICHYQQRPCAKITHPTAYCFHAWCYEILTRKVERYTESEIYKLSQILSTGSVLWERHLHRPQIENTSNETLRVLADSHQPLSKLLRLPAELRNMVWKYIGLEAAFSATVLVAEETTRLLRALNSSSYQTVSLTQGSHISIKMLTVFGTSYIQSLADGSCPEVIPGVTIYLKFAMVYGGICAVQLYGSDWNTSWLGVLPNSGRTWYGCIRRPGHTIACSSNGLYLTSLSSLDDQIFWDQPDIPTTLCNPDKELFDFKRDIDCSYQLPRSRQPRYFGYLPLLSDNEYVNGLTFYLSGNGIVGIESHFTKTSRLIGSRDGCPKYFSFHSGEQIAFTWLCIINSQSYVFAAPIVTIQTTLGRIHTFGPYVLPQQVMNDEYKWILLDRTGFTTGFYIEWPISAVIMRIGVTRESNPVGIESPNLEFIACGAPHLPRVGPNAGLFMSVANLSNLRRIEICRVGIRCTGLKLYYYRTPTAVLGQWHSTIFSQHVSISNSNMSNTMGIRFIFSKFDNHQVVTDISFGADAGHDCNSSYFRPGETITWWFSKSDDVICLWDGKVLPVPQRSIIDIK